MYRIVLLMWVTQAVAAADYKGPLLTLRETGSYMDGLSLERQCKIYPDHVVRTKTGQAKGQVDEIKTVRVDVDTLNREIEKASHGSLTSQKGRKGSPTVSYRAVQFGSDGTPKVVLLHQNGGEKVTNDSSSALALKNFVDQHCQ